MKKHLMYLIIIASSILCLTGCGEKENEPINWTYEMLEEEFGGIIETDCISVRNCLNILSWEDYYVCGYVTNVNLFAPDLLTIADNLEGIDTISVMQNANCEPLYAQKGDFIYAKGEVKSSLDSEMFYLSCFTSSTSNGYVSYDEKDDINYIGISDFLRLMKKIYKDTYFKTSGLVMKDGETLDGTPRYYLYPSEEAYKEDKLSRVEPKFSEPQSNLVGKEIVVIGNPDKDASFQGLKECSILNEP